MSSLSINGNESNIWILRWWRFITQIPMIRTCIVHRDVYLNKTHILALIIIYNYDMNTTMIWIQLHICTLSQLFISSMCLIICVNILIAVANFLPPCKIIWYAKKKKHIYITIFIRFFFSLIRNIMDEHTANVMGK